jgi:hypothetical protein
MTDKVHKNVVPQLIGANKNFIRDSAIHKIRTKTIATT